MLKTAQAFFACAVFCFFRGIGAKKKISGLLFKISGSDFEIRATNFLPPPNPHGY